MLNFFGGLSTFLFLVIGYYVHVALKRAVLLNSVVIIFPHKISVADGLLKSASKFIVT